MEHLRLDVILLFHLGQASFDEDVDNQLTRDNDDLLSF